MSLRTLGLSLAIFVLGGTLHAQERLVSLNQFASPTIVESSIFGGPPIASRVLPQHGLATFRPNLVAMAGARYLFWIAWIGPFLNPTEVLAVFDRRTGGVAVVPGVAFVPGTVQLVRDPRRPRVFVHQFGTLGQAGRIGVVDDTLTYRPLLAAGWIGTAFSYASSVNRFFVTRVGTIDRPSLSVVAYDADGAIELTTFVVPGENDIDNQLVVTSDGQTVFFYANGSSQIQAFNVSSGLLWAQSLMIDLTGVNRFELDEPRGLLLIPHRVPIAPFIYTRLLLALDATTLSLVGAANASYGEVQTFQPLRGRGVVGAFLLSTPYADAAEIPCRTLVDVFTTSGSLARRIDVAQQIGVTAAAFRVCTAVGAILSAPPTPIIHLPQVQGNNVTLTWTNPGDTSSFRLDVGFAPGRTDLSVPMAAVTSATFVGVPAGVYFARIRAVNEIGVSPASNEISIAVP